MPLSFEGRLAEAAQVARRYESGPGFLGAFAFGSGIRPYADETSDLDVGIVVDGADWPRPSSDYVHEERRRVSAMHRDVDLSFWTPEHLSAPSVDAEHRLIATCWAVQDPRGVINAAKTHMQEKLSSIREARLRVHYMDIERLGTRLMKAYARRSAAAVVAIKGAFIMSATQLLFLIQHEWPAPAMWMTRELEVAGVPRLLVTSLEKVVEADDASAARTFRRRLEMYMDEQGVTFGRDPVALWDWAFHSAEGPAARAQWGGLASAGA